MVRYLILYAITLGLFFAIDLTWLGVVAKNLYKAKLGFIMSEKINWAAAIIFYLIYIAGILYFAVIPTVDSGDILAAAIKGGALGLLCYATYDLNNMATIAGWPLMIVVIDIVWGIVLTASCSVGTVFIAGKIWH